MSAVRNLNGQDVKGRPLRIDLADSDPFLEGKTTTRGELDEASIPFKIPAGVPVPPGSSALDVISNVIATMQPRQLIDVMGHMKAYAHDYPEQARLLLKTQPQLSYALFQAMLMNNIVDPTALQVRFFISLPGSLALIDSSTMRRGCWRLQQDLPPPLRLLLQPLPLPLL